MEVEVGDGAVDVVQSVNEAGVQQQPTLNWSAAGQDWLNSFYNAGWGSLSQKDFSAQTGVWETIRLGCKVMFFPQG